MVVRLGSRSGRGKRSRNGDCWLFGCLVVGEEVGCCGGARERTEAERAERRVCVRCVVIAREVSRN